MMNASLRNQLLRATKELSVLRVGIASQMERRHRAWLSSLSDGDLRRMHDGPTGGVGSVLACPSDQLLGPMGTVALELVAQEIASRSGSKLHGMFPDEGPYRRELYPRHMEFLAAGSTFRERLFMAGNRTGKTETGAYELTCHLTGIYPDWWRGKRFSKPINAWACGTTNGTTRDIVQEKLLGPVGARGSGMIPSEAIVKVSNKQGLPNAADSILVKHVKGGCSHVGFKSYESGRKSFEGTAQEVIWLDEESPLDIYIECLYRTATTGGVLYTTFTPLGGMSDVVKLFLEPESEEARLVKRVTQCDWSQVPHLDDTAKAQLLASTPLYQRDARTKGIPQLGAGAIYPLAESDIIVRASRFLRTGSAVTDWM